MKCGQCKFFRLLGKGYVNSEYYRHAGECRNPEVYDGYKEGTLVRAGGSDGDGDYFHVHENFGCIKFENVTIVQRLIEQINIFPRDAPKVLELCKEDYSELMRWVIDEKSPVFHDTGYDTDRECFVFVGFDIKPKKDSIGAAG